MDQDREVRPGVIYDWKSTVGMISGKGVFWVCSGREERWQMCESGNADANGDVALTKKVRLWGRDWTMQMEHQMQIKDQMHTSMKCELTFNLVWCFEPFLFVVTKTRFVVMFRQHHDVCIVRRQQVHAVLYHLKLTQCDYCASSSAMAERPRKAWYAVSYTHLTLPTNREV